jgi:lipoprotein-anchoring transpeptidase ErfK/SrfK
VSRIAYHEGGLDARGETPPMTPRRLCSRSLLSLLVFLSLACLTLGCGLETQPAPTETPLPPTPLLPSPTPTLAPPTPTPAPEPTATPALAAGEAIVIGGVVRTRSEPSSRSSQVGSLSDLERVDIAARVAGENWLVGSQTWVSSVPAWATEWFQLADGSYVYGAFVFILGEGEVSPLAAVPDGVEKWIDVDVTQQVARAMVGDEAVFTAPISSGAAPFETPLGSFAVEPDGRIAVERMTASQAGYDPSQARYDVERVLFTQYFDRSGDALHLNYWRPHSVFGVQATSHGCVGLELHEAQYLWLFASAGTRVEIHGG